MANLSDPPVPDDAAVVAAVSPARWLSDAWPSAERRRMATTSLVAAIVVGFLGLSAAAGRWGAGADGIAFGSAPKSLPWSLPYGKGMWIWQPDHTEGGDALAIVSRARETGLTHLYVRTGSSWDGFYAGPFLDRILPAAHAAGIRVYGWDFPRLLAPGDDVARAAAAVAYRTPSGHRIDGFAADIETASEGTSVTAESATAYGNGLRDALGESFPLVAVVPRPSQWLAAIGYPYAEIVQRFDAVAPMVYWLNREPGSDVAGALADLRPYGKPVFPVGQAFDGGPVGGRPGVPPRTELLRFFSVAYDKGADGVSFWSWQAADQQAFDSIRDAPEFRVRVPGSATLNRSRLLRRH